MGRGDGAGVIGAAVIVHPHDPINEGIVLQTSSSIKPVSPNAVRTAQFTTPTSGMSTITEGFDTTDPAIPQTLQYRLPENGKGVPMLGDVVGESVGFVVGNGSVGPGVGDGVGSGVG